MMVGLCSFYALLVVVGAEGSVGAAMVKLVDHISVVDGEHCPRFPMALPGLKPVPVAFVDFDALPGLGIWNLKPLSGFLCAQQTQWNALRIALSCVTDISH